MKKLKKLASMLLALAMVVSFNIPALAAAGDYTITIENATIGKEYSAYKIFDATYDEESGGVSYTISTSSQLYSSISQMNEIFELKAATDNAEIYYVTVKEGVTGSQVIAAIESLGIEDLLEATASKTADKTTFTLDVGEPGYYYVTSELGSQVTVTTAAPDATVVDKNEVVGSEFHKYIVDGSGNTIQYDDAALGEELNFDITSNVPLYEGNDIVLEYQFTDTLSDSGIEIEIEVGTDFKNGDIHEEDGHYYAGESLINQFVTFTDGSGNTYTLADVASDYTLEFTDVAYNSKTGCIVCSGFILTYYTYDTDNYTGDDDYDFSNYLTDLSIKITYTTYLTEYGNHFESNTAMLNYWVIGPNDTPDPGTNSGETSTDYVYNWDLKILKIDGTDTTRLLKDATFTLYGTNLIDVNVRADYTYRLITMAEMEEGVTYYYKTAEGRWITTPPSGGDRDQYDPVNAGPYVREVTYSEAKEAGADYTVEGVTDNKGVVIFDGLKEGTYTITEIVAPDGYNLLASPITITVAFDSETGTFSVTDLKGLSDNLSFDVNNEIEITILNNAGTELPSTGGIGTTVFYAAGICLMLGAAVVLITRRRMRTES